MAVSRLRPLRVRLSGAVVAAHKGQGARISSIMDTEATGHKSTPFAYMPLAAGRLEQCGALP